MRRPPRGEVVEEQRRRSEKQARGKRSVDEEDDKRVGNRRVDNKRVDNKRVDNTTVGSRPVASESRRRQAGKGTVRPHPA